MQMEDGIRVETTSKKMLYVHFSYMQMRGLIILGNNASKY